MRHCIRWFAFGLVVSPASLHAETFVISDGRVIEGTALRSLGNTLTIKLDNAGMFQLPLGSIERVEMEADDGQQIAGSLAWWADGVYVIVTGEGLVEVRDGVAVRVSDSALPPVDTESDVVEPEPIVAPSTDVPAAIDEQVPQKLEPTM